MCETTILPSISVVGRSVDDFWPTEFGSFLLRNIGPAFSPPPVQWIEEQTVAWQRLLGDPVAYFQYYIDRFKEDPAILNRTLYSFALLDSMQNGRTVDHRTLISYPSKYSVQSDKFSGSIFTPFAALASYFFGNGVPRRVSIKSLSLRLRPEDIPMLISFADRAPPGKHSFSQTFIYDTVKSSVVTAAYLGHITLIVDGHVHVRRKNFANEREPGWRFSATLRALPDKYDANPSTHRGPIAEASTWVLSQLPGKPYTIHIDGTQTLKLTRRR